MVIAAIGATAAVASAASSIAKNASAGSQQSSNVSGNQAQVQNRLLNLQPQFDTALATETAAYQPYSTTGQAGLGATSDLLGLNGQPAADAAMARFQASPGYGYQLQQGLRAVDAGAAASGMLRSGATLKAEQTLGSNLANQDFSNYYARLAGLAGGGLTAAGGLDTANQQYLANMAGNVQQANTSSTDATNAQNSILGNTSQGIGNNINNLLGNQNVQNLAGSGINRLFGPTSVGDYSIPGTGTFGQYGPIFGSPAAGTSGGFNNGADLVNPGGSVVVPPIPPAPGTY